jgi:hypothetical protein
MYREMAHSMDKVGWQRFMEGMILKEVVGIQRSAPVDGGGTLSLEKWGVGLVSKLLEVTHGQWLYRNVHVHNMSTGDLVTRRKEELRRHLEEQIALGGEGLAEEDHYLLEINLDELDTTSWEEQMYWLLHVQHSCYKSWGTTATMTGKPDERRGIFLCSCSVRRLKALDSLYYPGVILEGESRSLMWPLAATLSVLDSQRVKTPSDWLKCLGNRR